MTIKFNNYFYCIFTIIFITFIAKNYIFFFAYRADELGQAQQEEVGDGRLLEHTAVRAHLLGRVIGYHPQHEAVEPRADHRRRGDVPRVNARNRGRGHLAPIGIIREGEEEITCLLTKLFR
jgi:hypothetical protein